MLYELATLSCPLLKVGEMADRVREWTGEASGGEVMGMWRSEIGTLGELLVLREFETQDDLRAERERALLSGDPFRAKGLATALSMDSYAPFPFLPRVAPKAYGGFFEVRTYRLKPGGLPATMSAWKEAIGPAKVYTDHLVVNMYALDGSPRITHIWGFSSLEERTRLRTEHYASGLWPPKGGPDQIAHATSTIAVAEPGLPLG